MVRSSCVLFICLFVVSPASAFTVDDFFFVFDGFGNIDVEATLTHAARWDANPSNPRGLADGIQVAVEAGFAEALEFGDLSAAEVEGAIFEAFATWETSTIHFDIELDAAPIAEINLMAADSRHPTFQGNHFLAWTSFLPLPSATRMLTNGQVLPGNTMLIASILFAADRLGDNLPSLLSIMTHEIGHTLGFDHSDQFAFANFDSDNDPSTEIVVDPLDPFANLMVSPNWDIFSAMTTIPKRFLSADDRSGLGVMYPSVPEPSVGVLIVLGLACSGATRRDQAASRRCR